MKMQTLLRHRYTSQDDQTCVKVMQIKAFVQCPSSSFPCLPQSARSTSCPAPDASNSAYRLKRTCDCSSAMTRSAGNLFCQTSRSSRAAKTLPSSRPVSTTSRTSSSTRAQLLFPQQRESYTTRPWWVLEATMQARLTFCSTSGGARFIARIR